MSFFKGSKKRNPSNKLRDGEDSGKVKENNSLSSLSDEVFFREFKLSGIIKITCKLFKKFREPRKGAFYFQRRGKGRIPN